MLVKPPSKETPQPVYLADYRKPDFLIPDVFLHFDLFEDYTEVFAKLKVVRTGDPSALLKLNGERLQLLSIKKDGRVLTPSDYELNEKFLTLSNSSDVFELEIVTRIDPKNNTALEGLYKSGDIFCTQNESEGFRKITYYLDRPDVMSRYTTEITADKARYPVLLSNGNLIECKDLPGGRHFVKWSNPFSMPCYLFALVAGDLAVTEDFFVTRSGRRVKLQIFADKGNESKCGHAMQSLKQAMKWDEDTFGLEYDLDIYMIAAVDAFNFGAMENKGLNIFNSQYVLADPQSATDQNYEAIQGVVGHEYFHNWTGNRVTCRDWFQITLKEGLTVFRDQEFSSDMNSRAVKRISDVRRLRDYQFPEDAGPNSHPIRPPSYIEINNFYTATVYEKGSEVVRMIETLIGRENFKKGITKYFELYDGQAVTTDDFIRAMEIVSGCDLTQFKRWYSQAGTPVCSVKSDYDPKAQTLRLEAAQKPGGGPPEKKEPFYFPLKVGLMLPSGKELRLADEGVLVVSQANQVFEIPNVPEKPVLSLLRGFSAPVKLICEEQGLDDLLFLLAHDTDSFNKYEAAQRVFTSDLKKSSAARLKGLRASVDARILEALGKVLSDKTLDSALLAEILTLPSQTALLQEMKAYDFDGVFEVREQMMKEIAVAHELRFASIYRELHVPGSSEVGGLAAGRRLLKNKALQFLLYSGNSEYLDWAYRQFQTAGNMTDEIAALAYLCQFPGGKKDESLSGFYAKWKHNPLVMNKWFAVQADSKQPGTFESILKLEKDPLFDIRNPNKVRSLIGVFTGNLVRFHETSGRGYAWLAEKILQVDALNASVAAHLAQGYKYFSKLDAHRKDLMRAQLEKLLKEKLSPNTFEIVTKTLESGKA